MPLSYARWHDGSVDGLLLVENLAYDKQLTIVYSTDGWSTVQYASAEYGWTSIEDSQEYWRFDIPLAQPGDEVQLAVRYDVDGATYWDNDLARDYTLPTPADEMTTIPTF